MRLGRCLVLAWCWSWLPGVQVWCYLIPPGETMAPSLFPLQYITPGVVVQYSLDAVSQTAINALIPKDSNEALAIFISEGVGGFLGGGVRRVIGRIDGNKLKSGSDLLSAAGGATYFGVAGAVRSLAYAGGASQLAVSLSALLTSVTISAVIRIRAKIIEEQRTTTQSFPKIKMYDLMRFRDPSMRDLMYFRSTGDVPEQEDTPEMRSKMTQTEFQADAAQFTLLSLLVPSGAGLGSTLTLEQSVLIGALCGVAGQGVREARDKEMEEQRRRVSRRRRQLGLDAARPDYVFTRLARASVEGAGQLLTYQAARDYVREVSPFFPGGELPPLVPPLDLPEPLLSFLPLWQ